MCLRSYRDAMAELSEELKCDFVDMNEHTRRLMERVGREEAEKFFVISTGLAFRDYTLGESNIAFSLIVSGTYAPNDMCADHTLIIDYDRLQTRVGGLLGTADGYIETVSNGN